MCQNRLSMNVIWGCKGLNDRHPRSDVFYVVIYNFIDHFYAHIHIMDTLSTFCMSDRANVMLNIWFSVTFCCEITYGDFLNSSAK